MVYTIGLVAHVFLATLAFGFGIVSDFVLSSIAASRDPRAIRAAYRVGARFGPMIGPMFLGAILLGFWLAHERGDSLLTGWLLIAYALMFCGAAVGAGYNRSRALKVLAAATASGDDRPSPELERAIGSARPIGAWCMLTIMAALITVMYVKPFA